MIRNIFLSLTVASLAVVTLKAEPSPAPAPNSRHASAKKDGQTGERATSASGWSVVNGVWTHSDGYKYVNGKVVRVGARTHKAAPKPPTKAELDSAKRVAAREAALATPKPAEKPVWKVAPAPQTGTHL